MRDFPTGSVGINTIILTLFLLMVGEDSPAQELQCLRAGDLNLIYYSDTHSYVVPHLARCYLSTMKYYRNFWDYSSEEGVGIFLEDFSDWANGGATSSPRNFVYVSISPYLYVFEVAPANERMSLLMHHELTHIVAIDKPAKSDRFYRSLFGKVQQTKDNPTSLLYAYLTTPRKFSPRWYHEGIAVCMETWTSGGIGRGLGSYDEMVFRSMVRDSAYIYHLVGLEAEGTSIDFQVGANSYLYGTRFFTYLGTKYGPEKLIEWENRTDGSKRYFSLQFRRVFGIGLSEAWSNWIEFEHEWQEKNLQSIGKNPVTPFNPITDVTLGSVSRSFYDRERNVIYTAVKYPGQVAHIAEIDLSSGKIRKICDVKGASTYNTCSLVWVPETHKLYFTTDNYHYRDLNVVDIFGGKPHRLITDLRAGDMALNRTDKSLWAVRHENGISTLIRLDPPYTDWTAAHAFPYGTDIYDLDVSPDGKYLTGALTHIDGKQTLAKFEMDKIASGDFSYDEIFDFDYSSPANFVFSEDGRYLYGTSYYSGVSNIFRYDFAEDDICALSNCETGLFRPLPVNDDSLIAFRYTGGQGFTPGWTPNRPVEKVSAIRYLGQELIDKHPVVKGWQPGSPAKVDLDSLTTYRGGYSVVKNTRLNSAYPIVEGYKDYTCLGYRFELSDAVGLNRLNVNLSYTPLGDRLEDEERAHFSFKYNYWSWELSGAYNRASFYDLFGPTRMSRKGYFLQLGRSEMLIYDRPRTLEMGMRVAGYGGLETLPDYQNVAAGFKEMYAASANLQYNYVEKSLGAVDEEKGYKVGLNALTSLVKSELYPKFYTTVDYGVALPVNHCSFWLRNAAGIAFGDRTDPFANFYFGGFGNNWVDYQSEKRYRSYYSFPGIEINRAVGRNFTKSTAELNLPPLRFRKIGMTSLYLRWLRPALFTSVLGTNLDSPDYSGAVYSVGAQIDFEVVLLSLLKTKLSVGYAAAVTDDDEKSDEFMLSLKIL